MEPNHNCNEMNCTGPKYAGLNLTCSRCLLPKFFECISDRTEVVQFVNAMKLKDFDLTPQTNASENSRKMKSIFDNTSVFEFVCPKCKSDGTYMEIKAKLDKKISELQTKNRTANANLKKRDDDIKSLQIALKNATENPDTSNNQKQNSGNDDQESEQTKIIELESQMKSQLKSFELIMDDVNKVITDHHSRTEKFKIDSDRAHETVFNLLKPIVSSHFDQSEHDRAEGENEVNEMQNHTIGRTSQPDVSLQNEGKMHVHGDGSHQTSMNFDDELKPPNSNRMKANPVTSNQTKLHEIFVTQFDPSVECEHIIRHILKRTKISADSFAVEKLIGSKERLKRKTYISFKISTVKNDVCKTLLNEKLWAPDFTARIFDRDPPKTKNDGRGVSNKYERDSNQRYNNGAKYEQNRQQRPYQTKRNSKPNERRAGNDNNGPSDYYQRRNFPHWANNSHREYENNYRSRNMNPSYENRPNKTSYNNRDDRNNYQREMQIQYNDQQNFGQHRRQYRPPLDPNERRPWRQW